MKPNDMLWMLASIALAACSDVGGPATDAVSGNDAAAQSLPTPRATSAAAPAGSRSAASGAAQLTATGWGPLTIGMSRAAVEEALGPDANPQAVGGAEPDRCDEFRPEHAPKGMLLMVENGRLTRISLLEDAAIRTPEGIGVGDTAATVRSRYGDRARVSPHKYVDAPAGYIDIWSTGGTNDGYVRDTAARGIRYEIGADGNVQSIHAGGPAIQYVEGCS